MKGEKHMSNQILGTAWEQGIIEGPDRQILYESLGRCGTNSSRNVDFHSHTRVLSISINSLSRRPGCETGMEFNLTGIMELHCRSLHVEGWYNAATGMGHLIIREIYKK